MEIRTWADGYGRWHAAVPRDPAPLDRSDRSDEHGAARRAAIAAITAELDARDARSSDYVVDVELYASTPACYLFFTEA
jgi:hypothetical protein